MRVRQPWRQRIVWWTLTTSKRLGLLLGLIFLAGPALAQQPVTISGTPSVSVSGTATVSGTVTSNQGGTWTVQPGNTQNSTAWLVTGLGGTFPATQSGTWTVQPGNTANTTAWLVTGTGGTFPATQSGGWTVAVSNSAVGSALAVRCVDTTGSTFEACGGSGSGSNAAASATGSAVPSSAGYTGINVSGTLRGWTGLSLGSHFAGTVAIVDGSGNQVTSFGGSGGTASNFGSAVPSTGTAAGWSDGTNMQAPRVFDGDTGAGSQYVPGVILRASGSGGTTEVGTAAAPLQVSLANTGANGTAVAVSLSGNQAVNLAQIAGNSTSAGNGASGTGVQRVTIANDSTGVVGLNAGSNLIGQVGRKNTFDAVQTVTTTTNFTSLGSGSGWSGGSITTSGCYDIRFRLQTKGSSASNTAYVDWYLASSMNGETTFDDAASSSTDQAFTAGNRKNSRYVGSVLTNSTNAVTGSFSALDVFTTLPAVIVPIAINNSGAALSSTSGDHVLKYECVR